MITRIRQLLVALLIVAIAIYVVIANNTPISISLLGETITANTGVILITAFSTGLLCATLIAGFLALKGFIRERRLKLREKERLAFYDGFLEAREFLAAEEWTKAQEQWSRIVKKDPTNIIARIELSRSLEGMGEVQEALRVVEEARSEFPKNTEVLFRAVELNLVLKNKTAALDNLALILYHHPNKRAARLARDLSESLGRIEDAIEYQSKLEELGLREDSSDQIRSRLNYLALVAEYKGDDALLEEPLRLFVRGNPASSEALRHLASIEKNSGRTENAAQLLIKAARASETPTLWHEVSDLWIANKNPEKALSSAKTALKDCEGTAKLCAQLELVRLQISLDMLDDAMKGLDDLPLLAKEEGLALDEEISFRALILRGYCHSRRKDFNEVREIWEKLCNQKFEISPLPLEKVREENAQPAARLSTP